MMNNMIKRKAELILKYMRGRITGAEQMELDKWIAASEENRALFERITESRQLRNALVDYVGNKTKTWEQIEAVIAAEQKE